ncbi:ribulose-phosphate 3-epimerase [Catellicoccus marimammalium]|uniref:Ribulose-phosphate 3-epimerase n=1 Tax=Catellicoccus marimammalium M35/04/3 TaxID=1234409 RepID=K8ZQQ3_9ENTE|nr:ribulose-phosphate 3-epimerase [Catellicoccus marimammalium]EKU27906.1 Ribulose-phosphate 3-epimerase [Catellicoccus marimammalium M35/04/3]
MVTIAPSILSANLWEFGKQIEQMMTLGVDTFHIDVMDRHFVPNLGYSQEIVKVLKKNSTAICDVHLMVEHPEAMIMDFINAGADYLTIHAESTVHPYRALQMIQEQGVKVGLALNPGTSLASVKELLPLVDRLLIMTVNPGFGGQSFLESQLAKIAEAKALREEFGYTYDIEVDGGINDKTASSCIKAGAEVLVSGSYLFHHSNWQEALLQLQE